VQTPEPTAAAGQPARPAPAQLPALLILQALDQAQLAAWQALVDDVPMSWVRA
jgi:hypothetical protein